MHWVRETISCFRRVTSWHWNIPGISYSSIPCLLMNWRRKQPGHQQQWYWTPFPGNPPSLVPDGSIITPMIYNTRSHLQLCLPFHYTHDIRGAVASTQLWMVSLSCRICLDKCTRCCWPLTIDWDENNFGNPETLLLIWRRGISNILQDIPWKIHIFLLCLLLLCWHDLSVI